jgi:hypothetical protein
MRSDLGRLDAVAEILQIGPFLGHDPKGTRRLRLASRPVRWYVCREKAGENPMKTFRIAAAIVLLTAPAYAQAPKMNLIPEMSSKTPEEKEADEARDKAYKESLKKIPDVKNTDPWGNVRSDAPKDAPKTATSAKSRTKTGSSAN